MPLLFSYGTLQQEAVQLTTFGRLLGGHADELIGFEPARIAIDDPEIVARSGNTHYENAVHNGSANSRMSGMVFEVTEAELAAADHYERIAEYSRIEAPLASGKRAWVYVHYLSVHNTERDDV